MRNGRMDCMQSSGVLDVFLESFPIHCLALIKPLIDNDITDYSELLSVRRSG